MIILSKNDEKLMMIWFRKGQMDIPHHERQNRKKYNDKSAIIT